MNIPLVDLKRQYDSIKGEIDSAISDVLSKSTFVGGPFVESFERAFASFCGVKHCIGVGNGTDALFIAMKCLGIGEGDEVIVPANSFIATSESVTLTGAKVVFVDINPKTYNMDPTQLEDYLKRRSKGQGVRSKGSGTRNSQLETRSKNLHLAPRTSRLTPGISAVIPVHLYGQPADMDPIMDIARRYGLKVIEDAAQAHGALYKGRTIGSIGDIACFSFYPGKNLGAYGDGGAIVTDNHELAVKMRMFANHGRMDKYDHELEGVNSRLDGLQGAILGVKLKHLPEWLEKRRRNAHLYNELLKETDLTTPVEISDVQAVYHLYVVRTKKEFRHKLQDYLRSKGIATGIHYPIALPNLKAYARLKHTQSDFPEATQASQEVLSLPMFAELEEEEIGYIAQEIRNFQGKDS